MKRDFLRAQATQRPTVIPPERSRRRGYYTIGWLIAVLTLYGAHELDGHWLGATIVLAGYVVGALYVSQQEARHG